MLAVVCYLWHDPYRINRGYAFTHDHIRTWKSMVDRNLTVPHKTICVTDDEIDGVETFPLDWRKHVPGTVFLRLMHHNTEIGKKIGSRILSLDVDLVVTGNIDHIVKRQEPAVWWRNPNFPSPARSFYQSSVQLFTPGETQFLWDDFDPKETPKWVNWRFGGREQAWLAERMDWKQPYFSEKDGVYGAGRLVHGQQGEGVYGELPGNACIVSVPGGGRAPWLKDTQDKHPWIKEHWR